MTDQDIADALDACRNTLQLQADPPQHLAGLTPTSRKRVIG